MKEDRTPWWRCGLVLVGAASWLAVAAPMVVQAQMMATRNPAQVPAARYMLEPSHTQIEFALSHMGFSTYYGRFGEASGWLDFVPAHPEASHLEITVPVSSLSTTSPVLNQTLVGAEWFDAQRWPVATFRSTSARATGPESGEMTGDLTLHGMTRPVTLTVRFNGGGINPLSGRYTIGFEGRGNIRRSAFGISRYLDMVGDDVQLIISAPFEKP
ncbi:putative exported protein [Granulibacter bethesdensis]|uniref:Exported protein n=1 Tax=Granulibacter bethesdensis TaxID=364410 RepID=A0AAN0RFX5_9PROT|nr:YceI family protein [Granulibacter bethesdensis]AHJ64228.1 putative exported protein [Granulibacter bethesdensis]